MGKCDRRSNINSFPQGMNTAFVCLTSTSATFHDCISSFLGGMTPFPGFSGTVNYVASPSPELGQLDFEFEWNFYLGQCNTSTKCIRSGYGLEVGGKGSPFFTESSQSRNVAEKLERKTTTTLLDSSQNHPWMLINYTSIKTAPQWGDVENTTWLDDQR